MVKANGYGHGLLNIAKLLQEYDVKLGVANASEAIELRKVWKKEIVIVEPIKSLSEVQKHNFEFVVEDLSLLKDVKNLGLLDRCYIKINIGMNRFGLRYDDFKTIKKFAKFVKNEHFLGLMAHFSCLENLEKSKIQYDRFEKVKKIFGKNVNVSFGGSGVINTDFDFDDCRVGIGFYGY